MMKRRKDSGFTLIELMIVIAVIGILAIVLVPRVGTVKAQAKETGLDTNVRVIQGYVESKIDKWVSKGSTADQVQADIVAALSDNKGLTNPFTSVTDTTAGLGDGATPAIANQAVYVMNTTTGADVTGSDTTTEGTIIVSVSGAGPITGVSIYAHGENGLTITEKTVTVTP